MSDIKLKKSWNNHNKGTVLKSVSPGIVDELVKGNFADKPEKKARKEVKRPPSNKAVSSAPSNKAVGSSPSTK